VGNAVSGRADDKALRDLRAKQSKKKIQIELETRKSKMDLSLANADDVITVFERDEVVVDKDARRPRDNLNPRLTRINRRLVSLSAYMESESRDQVRFQRYRTIVLDW